MLYAENTPNNLGVYIYGDFKDFENLYESLHNVVGDEEWLPAYSTARLRVLGVCYDLRHALLGNSDFTFVLNGLSDDIKKYRGIVASDKNLYLKIEVLWPEILFIMLALNDFLENYAKKIAKEISAYNIFQKAKVSWNHDVAQVRVLQAAIAKCIQDSVSEKTYPRVINSMHGYHVDTEYYFTQYIDLLNIRFIDMTPEKRLKNISIFAKRIAERNNQEYLNLKQEIQEAARLHTCSVEDIKLKENYPEELDW